MTSSLPDVSPYQIKGLIARGDIGAVYRAYDPANDREVALKGLWGKSPLALEERQQFFRHEADILSRLDHPRIPRLYDFVDGEQPFFAFQIVEGRDLEMQMRKARQPLPVKKVIRWAMLTCDILRYLHHREPEAIAFRDLKPSHIVADRHGRVWLVDFNLALPLPPDLIEREASLEGTPGFAAPEQYAGTVSPLSDIYGLGATLHYLLTGRDPRLAEPFTFASVLPHTFNPEVSLGLEAIILKAVEDDPLRRYQDALAMKAALSREYEALGR